MEDKDFRERIKLALKEEWFQRLFGIMRKQRDNLIPTAMLPGDTDYNKGEINGLTWAVNLPDAIASETDADTAETASKTA